MNAIFLRCNIAASESKPRGQSVVFLLKIVTKNTVSYNQLRKTAAKPDRAQSYYVRLYARTEKMSEVPPMSSEHVLTLHKPKLSYGCVFCLTGKERLVANGIELFSKQARARAVCQSMRHTQNGVTTVSDDVVIPGYVFFEAPGNAEVHDLIPLDDLISVLSYSNGDWRLFGEDENYAKFIFKYDGLLSLSKAHKIGEKIVIVEGPLKDLEGQITRIDKRNRSGQVTVQFAGRQQKIWLGFDIVKELPEHEACTAAREP